MSFERRAKGTKPPKAALLAAFALAAVVLLLLSLSGVAWGANSWDVKQITFNDHDDRNPQFSYPYLYWEGWDGSDYEIFRYDLRDGSTTQITNNNLHDFDLSVQNEWATWVRYDGNDNEIILYDVAAAQETQVTNNTVDDHSPDAFYGYVVWSGWAGSSYQIYLRNPTNAQPAGGLVRMVSNSIYDNFAPQISGDHVYWLYRDGLLADPAADTEVFCHQMSTVNTMRLTTNTHDDAGLSVRGALAVWEAFLPTGTEIMFFDPYNPGVGSLTSNLYDDHGPISAMQRVAWESRMRPKAGNIPLIETNVYDHLFGYEVTLTSGGAGEWLAAFDGTLVGWTPWDGNDFEVVVQDLVTGEATQLTDNTVDDGLLPMQGGGGLAVSDPYVAWVGVDGFDPDIFVATMEPTAPFVDVSPGDPYFSAIDLLRRFRVVGGYETAQQTVEFRPDNLVWRAQFAKMICGAMGYLVGESVVAPFGDLGLDSPTNLYPHDYVAVAAMMGVTTGKTPTAFAPWDDISRAQVVTMAVRAVTNAPNAQLPIPPPDFEGSLRNFDPIHGPTMRLAEYVGMLDGLVGFGEGWNPWAPATRAEVAQILRMLMAR
jgi:hypothetical protein